MKLNLMLILAAVALLSSCASIIPVGSVVSSLSKDTTSLREIENDHWMLCDGRELLVENYKKLFEMIGTSCGTSAPGKFNLPDLRGMFLRGVSGGLNPNPPSFSMDPDTTGRIAMHIGGNIGNTVGSIQMDSLKSHHHSTMVPHYGGNDQQGFDGGGGVVSITSSETGGAETRPKNTYVYWIIKVK